VKTDRRSSPELATAFGLLILFSLFGLSCKESLAPPDTSIVFLTLPGPKVTSSGDAHQICWCGGGTRIAFLTQDVVGGNVGGTLKSVDLLSRTIHSLDGTFRPFNYIVAAGDSVLYDAADPISRRECISLVSDNGSIPLTRQVTLGSLFAISADRQMIFIEGVLPDTAEVVSVKDSVVTKLSFQELNGIPSGFSPDDKQLYFSDGSLLNIADGTRTGSPAPLPPNCVSLNWTQNGFYAISLSAGPGGDAYTITNLLTGASKVFWRQTMNDSFVPSFIWSSDGKKVAFERVTSDTQYLYAGEIDSATSKLFLSVQGRAAGNTSLSFSPDGKHIAYSIGGNIYFSDL